MATNNFVTNYTGNFDTCHKTLSNAPMLVSRYFDCSSVNLTGSDVYQIFTVEDGVTPVRFVITVHTAEGGAATLDIGDGDSTARYETDANLNSAATTISIDATKTYTAADTIDIIPSATLDAAKFTVTMEYYVDQTSTGAVGLAV